MMGESIDYAAELERIADEIKDRASDDPRGLREPKEVAIIRHAAALLRRRDEEKAYLQLRLDWRLANGGTADYRAAVNHEGPLAAQWSDKKHRLVYDLCSQVEAQAEEIARLRKLLAELEWRGDQSGKRCPFCRSHQAGVLLGHAPDCPLDAALKDPQ